MLLVVAGEVEVDEVGKKEARKLSRKTLKSPLVKVGYSVSFHVLLALWSPELEH